MRVALLGFLPVAVSLSVGRRQPAAVPKILHFMFKTDLRGGNWTNYIWEKSFNAWQKYFPEGEYQYMWWTDDMLDTQFKKSCPTHYDWYKKVSFSPDLSRACVLKEHGGIYSDLDYEPRQNFYGDIQPGKINLLESFKEGQDWVNVLMASPPGSAMENVERYWDGVLSLSETREQELVQYKLKAAYVTGPWLLDNLKNTTTDEELAASLPELIHTLPCKQFYRQGWKVGKAIPKPGCGGLRSWNLHTVKGIHWSTVSWYRPGSGKNIDQRHNRRAILSIEHGEISPEERETMFAGWGTSNGTLRRADLGQANFVHLDEDDVEIEEDIEVSTGMQDLFDQVHNVQ